MGGGIRPSIALGKFTFFVTATITVIQNLVQWRYSYLANKRQRYYKVVVCLWFCKDSSPWFLEENNFSRTLHSNAWDIVPQKREKYQENSTQRTWQKIPFNISQCLCFYVYFLSSFPARFLSHKCPWMKVKLTLFWRIMTVLL